MKKTICLFLFTFLSFSALPALADDSPSAHEIAKAVKNGTILALSDIQQKLEGKITGKIIYVEVERDDDVWVYEFKTITPEGRRKNIYLDAKTGVILREKHR